MLGSNFDCDIVWESIHLDSIHEVAIRFDCAPIETTSLFVVIIDLNNYPLIFGGERDFRDYT